MIGIFKEKKIENYIIENRNIFYKIAYSYTQNEEDALDVVQESIYKALSSTDSLKDVEKIKSWFYKILIRTSIDFIRKNKKYIPTDNVLEESNYDEYKNIDLDNALNKIPTKYKTIIILRYFEDFKIDEIANILDENVNTIKSRLYTALKKLKIEMKGDDLYESKKIHDLKENYMNIKISDKLEDRVNEAIKESKKIKKRGLNMKKGFIGVAASVAVVIGIINVSPAFADTVKDIPIVGDLVNLVVVKNYKVSDKNVEADINVSKIDGLKNKELQDNLNEEFMKEGKEAYENLIKEIPDIGEGKKYVGMDYKIKSETDSILSIEVSKSEIQASGYETRKHYVIDKEKQVVLTLPLIFKDKSYVDVISDNIKEQMRKQMKEDEGKSYFIDSDDDFAESDFKKISENQDFYINSNNDLIICFNEYEVAPGYMGPVEFVIPKEIVDKLK